MSVCSGSTARLRAVVPVNRYNNHYEWVDLSVDTDEGPLRIKGATDPIIVDEDAVPLLPTEIKTKSDIETLTSPNRHHRAQLHAYMAGLSEKFDIDLIDGVLLYASRKSLDVKVFHVTFDKEFWRDIVVEWASDHTRYRLGGNLPPASPEYDWECGFCDYRERCGRTDNPYEDTGPRGFLPLYDEYPKETVREYLDAHPEVKLTQTLARTYPDSPSSVE